MTSAPPDAPQWPLVIRWVDPAQARRYLQDNQILPSWRHFIPALGKARNGICFDLMTHANWRAPHRRIGLLIDTTKLPEKTPCHAIDGHKVYCLSEQMRWQTPQEQRAAAKEARANAHLYSGRADELFVTGTIDRLGSRLSGIVLLETDRKLGPKLQAEMSAFCADHRIPVLAMTSEAFSAAKCAKGGVRQALSAQAARLEIGSTPTRSLTAKVTSP